MAEFPIAEVAKAAADSYSVVPTWTAFGSVRAVRTRVGDTTVIAIPGTDDVRVFLLDMLTAKVPMADHPELGRVHHGFSTAAAALAKVITLDEGLYILTGHSFGGAVAQLLALELPRPPLAVVALAPARPFADAVSPLVLALTEAYRFGNDPVPDQPGWFPSVPCRPVGTAAQNPLNCHHVANYVSALCLSSNTTSL